MQLQGHVSQHSQQGWQMGQYRDSNASTSAHIMMCLQLHSTLPASQPLSDVGSQSIYIESTRTLIAVGKYAQIRLCLVLLPNCLKMGKNIWGLATKINGFVPRLQYFGHRTEWFKARDSISVIITSFESKATANQGGLVPLKYIKKLWVQALITSTQHFLSTDSSG